MMKSNSRLWALVFAAILGVSGVSSAIQSDNFNDGVTDPAWATIQDTPAILSLAETNERLEFNFGDNPLVGNSAEAMYISNGWSADLTADFAMRVDFYFTGPLTTGDRGVGLGLRFNDGSDVVRLTAGADGVNYGGYAILDDGEIARGVWWSRVTDSGTLYLSYEAAVDCLYLSRTGFWASSAISVVPGYVAGQLGATSADIVLSAYSVGATEPLAGSLAYLDNFVIPALFVVGDANRDGKVDQIDLGILATNWGRTDADRGHGDLTGDAAVNLSDLGILAANWGVGTGPVPEPMTLTLLAGGAIGLLGRRRK
jgi:hypothetical protein